MGQQPDFDIIMKGLPLYEKMSLAEKEKLKRKADGVLLDRARSEGIISDEFFTRHRIPEDPTVGVAAVDDRRDKDGFNMRSQRCMSVLCTHAQAKAVRAEEAERKKREEEEKKKEEEKKEEEKKKKEEEKEKKKRQKEEERKRKDDEKTEKEAERKKKEEEKKEKDKEKEERQRQKDEEKKKKEEEKQQKEEEKKKKETETKEKRNELMGWYVSEVEKARQKSDHYKHKSVCEGGCALTWEGWEKQGCDRNGQTFHTDIITNKLWTALHTWVGCVSGCDTWWCPECANDVEADPNPVEAHKAACGAAQRKRKRTEQPV